jgi:hypothetical protein
MVSALLKTGLGSLKQRFAAVNVAVHAGVVRE